ncbi:Reticulocalbin-3, partial [Cuculus canorus]
QETLEDMDKDGDGFIQEDEYIAELYEGSPGAPEPPWVLEERTQFVGARDRDGDGRLNPEEVGYWLRPPTAGWALPMHPNLLHHANRSGDGLLSRAEVLASWELFVGSRATTYGEDLGRPHDEL